VVNDATHSGLEASKAVADSEPLNSAAQTRACSADAFFKSAVRGNGVKTSKACLTRGGSAAERRADFHAGVSESDFAAGTI